MEKIRNAQMEKEKEKENKQKEIAKLVYFLSFSNFVFNKYSLEIVLI